MSFFFQAEDGIRVPLVTGVQTCALPIWAWRKAAAAVVVSTAAAPPASAPVPASASRPRCACRSEERRVGKECGARRAPWDENRKEEVGRRGRGRGRRWAVAD